MINLIEDNKDLNYRVYNSVFISDNIRSIRYEGKRHHNNYLNSFIASKRGSTWDYKDYNIFSLAGGSELFFQIYKDLIFVIKDYLKDQTNVSDTVWFQSWLNYHVQDEVLDWHDHDFEYHGYISIDPKDTLTEFRQYFIKNKSGNIYIGPGSREHRVVVNTPYDDTRITLGFNILVRPYNLDGALSFIPIIL